MIISRRNALLAGLAGSTAACVTKPDLGAFENTSNGARTLFSCGVASGDPAQDSVVLWTRVDNETGGNVRVLVEVAADDSFETLVYSEALETGPAKDWTVKHVATGLEPGTQYAFRFKAGDATSPAGSTKTLPEETDRVRFAVASCSHYGFGYFNAYDHIARQEGLDAVLHLGDYLYEYGRDGYGGPEGAKLGRLVEPAHEIVSLDDYRRRHRQYKGDAALQRMHAAHPLIAIWDDHETTNDSFKAGAENHQPETEGSWADRKRAALQAYYEYMPVRDPKPGRTREQLFKSYSWGKYLTLPVIESRLTARGEQLSHAEAMQSLTSPKAIEAYRQNVIGDPSREMLGLEQLQFLEATLSSSVQQGATWRVIGNQVMMARVTSPNLAPYFTEEDIVSFEPLFPQIRAFLAFGSLGLPLSVDTWDGYAAARQRFYQTAANVGARDLVVLTGDSHQFWANSLFDDDGEAMGIELGTSGITSPGASKYLGDYTFDVTLAIRNENPEVRYMDAVNKGYMLLDFVEDEASARFISVSTIKSTAYQAQQTASFDIEKTNGSVGYKGMSGLGFKERVLFNRT